MIRNYLAVTLRRFTRQKTFTAINVIGLAIGLTSSILLGLFVRHEQSYDRYHPYADRTFRVVRTTTADDGTRDAQMKVSGALGPVLRDEFPEVEEMVRLYRWDAWVVAGEDAFDQMVCVADEPFFNVFDVPMLAGNAEGALRNPETVLLTERSANRLFGSPAQAIGKRITLEARFWGDYTIVGVVKDLPSTTTLYFDVLMFPVGAQNVGDHWTSWRPTGARFIETFIVLRDADASESMTDRMQDLFARHMGPEAVARNVYGLQPLLEVHLYSRRDYAIRRNLFSMQGSGYGSIAQVQTASLIAVFILVIACVNFVNLSMARAERRAREVGLRKVVGARRWQIFGQLLGEAVMIALLSLVVAIGATQLLLPSFNASVGRSLSLWNEGPALLASLAALAVGVGVCAGVYPALYLSSFQPARVLKVKGEARGRGALLRRGLVVLQFGISIALIVASLTASGQMRYMRRNLGFETENIVVLPVFYIGNSSPIQGFGYELKGRYQEVKERFLRHPDVLAASTSRFYLQDYSIYGDLLVEAAATPYRTRMFPVDEDFFTCSG